MAFDINKKNIEFNYKDSKKNIVTESWLRIHFYLALLPFCVLQPEFLFCRSGPALLMNTISSRDLRQSILLQVHSPILISAAVWGLISFPISLIPESPGLIFSELRLTRWLSLPETAPVLFTPCRLWKHCGTRPQALSPAWR